MEFGVSCFCFCHFQLVYPQDVKLTEKEVIIDQTYVYIVSVFTLLLMNQSIYY